VDEELLGVLDEILADRDPRSWDTFFADRARPCPFFVDWPDENLVEWFDSGLLRPGRVLELGCGNGRDAAYLLGAGCRVDAIDMSSNAIAWAMERAPGANFQHCSIFAAQIDAGGYDLVYDSGCFHHLPPHRRRSYANLVTRALRPGGAYGLICFRPEGGSGLTDREVYEQWSLGGGLGYTEEQLRSLWDKPPFSVVTLRQMRSGLSERFGRDFLWTMLARKTDDAAG
jgi:SAM-dependent methyltransferase